MDHFGRGRKALLYQIDPITVYSLQWGYRIAPCWCHRVLTVESNVEMID